MLLDREKSTMFRAEQGVAEGCRLSPISFSVIIEQAELEVQFSMWLEGWCNAVC